MISPLTIKGRSVIPPGTVRTGREREVDTPSPSLTMRHAPKFLLHNGLSHQRLTPTHHCAKTSAKPLPVGTHPGAISPDEARWPTVGVPFATTARCVRLGSPILQHFACFLGFSQRRRPAEPRGSGVFSCQGNPSKGRLQFTARRRENHRVGRPLRRGFSK